MLTMISPLAILLLVCAALNGAGAVSSTKGNAFDDSGTASLLSAAIQQAAAKTCKELANWEGDVALPQVSDDARTRWPYRTYLTFACPVYRVLLSTQLTTGFSVWRKPTLLLSNCSLGTSPSEGSLFAVICFGGILT